VAGQKKLATDNKKNINKKLMIIPYDKLSTEALEALIEEFVTRDGTDTGYEKKSLENDVAMVKRQLKRGDVVIVFDQSTNTSNIVLKDRLKEFLPK
jgi:uncharacterized protein YheU (UPF0270 family)